jgi:putative FmdB family regulatory protein
MPTYQYACTASACGNRFELVQSFTDPNADTCPTCGGAVRKVFSAVGVVFKGSGFYRNDSRQAAGKKFSDSDRSTKTESTPAKAAAAKSGDSSGDSSTTAAKPAKSSSSDSSKSGSSSSSSGTSAPAASA